MSVSVHGLIKDAGGATPKLYFIMEKGYNSSAAKGKGSRGSKVQRKSGTSF